ncbi:MAG: hypothetical protein ACMVP2_09885 [Imperialibacter sp.]|uniref:hypothetical protein n=1 Tax=Imperialibacter sp. TaxID=2038411 RepID=UPI003A8BCAF1
MKLIKVLDQLNSLEKNSFIKIIDGIIADKSTLSKEANKILSGKSGQLKNADNENIAQVFSLVEESFKAKLSYDLKYADVSTDLAIDILIRDGNCIMSRDWFVKLFEKEHADLRRNIKEFNVLFESEENPLRARDYRIYRDCVHTAYYNDELNNRAPQITDDERSILISLSKSLNLSHEETRLIQCQIIPYADYDIEEVLKNLKDLGIVFYAKKSLEVYMPDEIVKLVGHVRGKVIADKHYRRVLRKLKDPQLNQVARRYNISRKLSNEEKIKEIINQGIDFKGILTDGIYKEDSTKTERKKFLNDFIEKNLGLETPIKGSTMEDKVANLILYFDSLDMDNRVSISLEGYDSLLSDLVRELPKIKDIVKSEFELQGGEIMNSAFLMDYNIKPNDILELIPDSALKELCSRLNIKTRGDMVQNILDGYKDVENILIENYELIANRDYNALKENGIVIKDADLGVKFEEITKKIFSRLSFNVNDDLNKKISNAKNKIDILIQLSDREVILVECKTSKDKEFSKFSSVSRQIKAYQDLLEEKNLRVVKSLLVANEFTDDFINECELDFKLNLSLIKASSLHSIYRCFKELKKKEFPYNLLLRDVLINEERVNKALSR